MRWITGSDSRVRRTAITHNLPRRPSSLTQRFKSPSALSVWKATAAGTAWQLPGEPVNNSAEGSLWLQITSYCIACLVTEYTSWPSPSPHLVSFPSSLPLSLILSPSIHPSVHKHSLFSPSNDFSSSYCQLLALRHRESIPSETCSVNRKCFAWNN